MNRCSDRLRMSPGLWGTLLAIGIGMIPGTGYIGAAKAADIVVVEAHGLALRPGQVLDDRKVLDLNPGQGVTMISAIGDTIKLRGPYHQRPAAGGSGGGSLTTAFGALLVHRGVRASDVGVVRAGTQVQLPEPWVIDVSHPGTRCVRTGTPVVFWRTNASKANELAVAPLNRGWRLTANWGAGTDRLLAPKELPAADRATYLIDIGEGPVAITLLSIPATVSNDPMLIAWMFEKGCNLQAEKLAQAVN